MADTSELGRTPGSSPSALTQAEPRASDNRLALDLSDPAFDFVQSWEDGNVYTLKVRVTQVSPGEFEVVSAEEVGGEEAETPEDRRGAMGAAAEEEPPPAKSRGGTGYKNPVIADMMAE